MSLNCVILLIFGLQIWQYLVNQSDKTNEPMIIYSSDSVWDGDEWMGSRPTSDVIAMGTEDDEGESVMAGQATLNDHWFLSQMRLLYLVYPLHSDGAQDPLVSSIQELWWGPEGLQRDSQDQFTTSPIILEAAGGCHGRQLKSLFHSFLLFPSLFLLLVYSINSPYLLSGHYWTLGFECWVKSVEQGGGKGRLKLASPPPLIPLVNSEVSSRSPLSNSYSPAG